MEKKAGGELGASGLRAKRVLVEKTDDNVVVAKKLKRVLLTKKLKRVLSGNKPKPFPSEEQPKPSGVNSDAKKAEKDTKFTYPQNYPLRISSKIDSGSVWRWWNQYQVWQGRLEDTGKKTLFCGLCGFICHGKKKILKHFLARHGNKKLYNCGHCEKSFCLRENAATHLDEVHGTSLDPWRWDWGPEEQQTELNDTDDDYPFGNNWRNRRDEDSDEEENEDSDPGKKNESDHEYEEERVPGAESESDPDSEGARDLDSDSSSDEEGGEIVECESDADSD
jgi:hypothetical protein